MGMLERIGRASGQESAFVVELMPDGLLDAPLDYIFADHFRHRRICAALKRCAALGSASIGEAEAIGRFLARDLVWHHGDEDEDLFPALRRRSLPQDDLLAALDHLEADHRRNEPVAKAIVACLTARPGGDDIRLDTSMRAMIEAFAAAEHRHLALENGIVLAIARIRLTRTDLAKMSRSMKRRREAHA
jgi:hypothetical protein